MYTNLAELLLVKNIYKVDCDSSEYIPIVFKPLKPVITLKSTKGFVASLVEATILPTAFSKAPTSSPSDLLTCILRPSLYSPGGNSLESRSLFILDLMKAFLTSAMYFSI